MPKIISKKVSVSSANIASGVKKISIIT